MKYSTGQKKRSRLQGHRKRRRTIEVTRNELEKKVSWVEYKTVRQYHAMGDMLDEFKVYGYRNGVENMVQSTPRFNNENGHDWLTEDFVPFEGGEDSLGF